MATLDKLIREALQRPVRKCYIKRRDLNGDYETEWVRIDNWRTKDRVLNWGSISLEINHLPEQITKFNVSNLSMSFENSEGNFNNESQPDSIWNGFLNRKYTKLKIDAGYLDPKGVEVGVANIFEGVIQDVVISDNQTSRIRILSYQNVIKLYDIKDLGLAATPRTVEQLIGDIMNQSKITKFIPYVAPTPDVTGVIIEDPSALEGSYWSILLYFAQITNSVPLLVGEAWSFVPRVASATSQWDFKGYGTDNQPDTYKIKYYDDEGADKLRLRFQEEDGPAVSVSTNETLLKKYLGDLSNGSAVEFMDLSNIGPASKQSVLDTQVDYWGTPRQVIELEVAFMVNELSPLDRMTVEYRSKGQFDDTSFRWNAWFWNSGPVWNGVGGAINISSGTGWMITRVTKNIDKWTSKIKSEEVVV